MMRLCTDGYRRSHYQHCSVNSTQIEIDDSEREFEPMPEFIWNNSVLHSNSTLEMLNKMRLSRHLTDVTLQIGNHQIYGHRSILAAVSSYFMELFTGQDSQLTTKEEGMGGIVFVLDDPIFDRVALEHLIKYAYTGSLEVAGEKVGLMLSLAFFLKMYPVVEKCTQFLADNLDVCTCLDVRAMPGISFHPELMALVDEFIVEHIDVLWASRSFRSLPRVCVEVFHSSKIEKDSVQPGSLCNLVLQWLKAAWIDNAELNLTYFTDKLHLLYVADDHSLQDCTEMEQQELQDSDLILDYRRAFPSYGVKGSKIRRCASGIPSKPRELLFSRHIYYTEYKVSDRDEDWSLLAYIARDDIPSIIAIATIDGNLTTLSVTSRLNSPSNSSTDYSLNVSTVLNTVPFMNFSRSSSLERPLSFEPLALISQPKCAFGCIVSKNDRIIICGGYNRGECLSQVEEYDFFANVWSSLPSMVSKRGRFEATIVDHDDGNVIILAAGGSDGQSELSSVEVFDGEKWKYVSSLPMALSSVGICSLNGKVYCIGGLYGQIASNMCFVYDVNLDKWDNIAPLKLGRSQAAVVCIDDCIWVVGGCDSWHSLDSVEIYNPLTDTWRKGPTMCYGRRGCGISYIASSQTIVVIGGSDGTRALCTTEVYSTESNMGWSFGPNLTTCRANVSTALVDQGRKLFAVGGFSGKHFLNTMEYLDRTCNEWTTFTSGNYLIDETKSSST